MSTYPTPSTAPLLAERQKIADSRAQLERDLQADQEQREAKAAALVARAASLVVAASLASEGVAHATATAIKALAPGWMDESFFQVPPSDLDLAKMVAEHYDVTIEEAINWLSGWDSESARRDICTEIEEVTV